MDRSIDWFVIYETFIYVLLLVSVVRGCLCWYFRSTLGAMFITQQNTERTAGPYLYMLRARMFVSACVHAPHTGKTKGQLYLKHVIPADAICEEELL